MDFKNLNFKDKYTLVMLIAAIGAVCVLLFPLASIEGEGLSLFDLFDSEASAAGAPNGFLVALLCIGGGGVAAFGGYIRMKELALGGSIAGLIGIFYFIAKMNSLFSTINKMAAAFGGQTIGLFDWLGVGAILALAAYIACIVLTVLAVKENN